MPLIYTEKRHQTRRSLKMPVTFFLKEKKGSISDYFFGWTKDISSQGTCISAKLNSIPDISILLTLLVAPEKQNRFSDSDILVPIRGKVAWNNINTQNFGVRFI
jgi:hypothetical protein